LSYPDQFPRPLYPDPGGLLLWASTGNGDELFWLTSPARSNGRHHRAHHTARLDLIELTGPARWTGSTRDGLLTLWQVSGPT
jgi:hypothetical protein